MQDRYAGDVGDFGKYGLLRALCREDMHGARLQLGVVWYFVRDETHNFDGKHVGYLDPSRESLYRACDPDLYARMRLLIDGVRSVQAIEQSGALPAGTAYFSEPLLLDYETPAARPALREQWLRRAAEATSDADVVFLDPDNGLKVSSVGSSSNKAAKHVLMGDLDILVKPHQSLVAYHHLGRRKHADEISFRLDTLKKQWPDRTPFGLRFRRGTSRAYLIAPSPDHEEILRRRAQGLIDGPWGTYGHFQQQVFPA